MAAVLADAQTGAMMRSQESRVSEDGLTLLQQLDQEIKRQDAKHGPYQGTRLGRSRLALATLEDELREALDAWRAERFTGQWSEMHHELLQVAAVAIRAIRDTDT